MPVIEDHPDYAVCYCEMCGSELDKGGNPTGANNSDDGGAEINTGALLRLVGAMSRWAIHKPVYMRVLASRIVSPHYTIRELGEVVGLNKSQVQSIMVSMVKDYPTLNTLLGFRSTRSRGQTNRRNKERTKDK